MNTEKTTTSTSVVALEEVTKTYRIGADVVTAVNNVSLEIAKGEFLALSGPSGSGKSTLLHLIGGIETPTSGRIWLEGRRIDELSDDQLSDVRSQRLSFVFQNFNLLPVLTAEENVEYPLLRQRLSRVDREQRVRSALERVGMADRANHRPLQLSGGQRQRVAIARALVTRPALILADEPTANLDHETGERILQLMQELNREQGVTFVFSTHDPRVVQRATRVVKILDGVFTDAQA